MAAAVHTERGSAARTVTVVCKLPNGMVCSVVDLSGYDFEASRANKPVFVKYKGKFRVRGYAEARLTDTAGHVETDSRRVNSMFGITSGVPKELWDEWWEQSKDCWPANAGLIYADVEDRSAISYAKENAERTTGFEAINPEKPAPGIEPAAYEGMSKAAQDKADRGMPAYTD